MKKALILILTLYLLTLIQTSFLVHFNILGVIFNLVLVFVCLLSFFEGPTQRWGFFAAVIGGFFLDIFSTSFIGISIFVLVLISFIFKISLYILKERPEKHPLIYFIPLFIFSVLLYTLSLNFISFIIKSSSFQISPISLLVEITLNFLLSLIGFYFFKKFKLKLR